MNLAEETGCDDVSPGLPDQLINMITEGTNHIVLHVDQLAQVLIIHTIDRVKPVHAMAAKASQVLHHVVSWYDVIHLMKSLSRRWILNLVVRETAERLRSRSVEGVLTSVVGERCGRC